MIRVTEHGDVVMMERLRTLDPFQLAMPLWLSPVLPQLPHVIPNTRDTREQQIQRDKRKVEQLMAIRLIDEKETPQRLHGRGTISSSQEYRDALNAIRSIPQGKSIIVTIESPDLLKVKKPETSFAYAVRRYLAANGVAATAYQSGKNEVVIRRDAVGAAPKKRKK